MNTLSHDQLLNRVADNPPKWVVEGLVMGGSIGFIAAEPKATKSWLALHMAQAVATGLPFMGKFLSNVSNVLYVQEEDSVETVMTRYRLLEKGHVMPAPAPGRINYAIQTGFKLDAVGAAGELTREAKLCGAKLIIMDVLNKLHTGNDSDQKHATKLMSVVEEVRRATGAAILIVHHFAKGSPGRRGNQRMRGSSVLAGWSENSLYLQRSGPYTHVEVENKFAETPNFSYTFKAENGGLRLNIEDIVVDTPTFKTARSTRLEREKRKKRAHVGGR
jgi:RecA-family ATPase